ncbi:MAG TPA: hypothetical protein K8V51_03365, partial [Campylobacter avium]|nr:hypothetical protein [Campylobacter avium]
ASCDKITLWAVLACAVFALQSKKTKDTKKLLQKCLLLGVGKECITYKLGEALIENMKRGGALKYLKFMKDVRRIKKEFKRIKNKELK